ncbi:hypothetical protein CHS0354_040438 [Potamilus streckersoni]|uniref:Nuclear RNA export factor 1 n=1 Tax=Potamilus streckersoni TaxID=2493646 RepID=A0AAE0W4Y4_9BIVA|nr:hypothetical protein CHS0354_040438 [Potamilus streckersoni]
MSSDTFGVTLGRDGSRRFASEHNDRWVRGGGRSFERGGWRSRNNFGKFNKGFYGRGKARGRGRGNFRGGFQGPGPRSNQDEDGDTSMDGKEQQGAQNRFSPYTRPNRRGRMDRRFDQNRPSSSDERIGFFQRLGLPVNTDTDSTWFRIMIPYGKKTGKACLSKIFQSCLDVPFSPVDFHFEQMKAVFYVHDKKCADALNALSRKITLPNGYKLVIIVVPSSPPYVPITDEDIGKLKVCMSKRYDPASKTLNLSNLNKDTDLQAQSLNLALNSPEVMSSVIKIIGDNIPELVALDVSDNNLTSLDHLAALTEKAPSVTKLNLGKNKLKNVDELEKIKGWTLELLILELSDRFKDQLSYISAVRQKFPKILNLDGHDIPPPITFDIESPTELPQIKGSFFAGNTEVLALLVKFVKDYFTVYDMDDRQGLLNAYHEQAMFSLSACYNGITGIRQPSLKMYTEDNRNLIQSNIKEPSHRNKLLKYGRLLIISQLFQLPRTTHDPNSFIVDVSYVSPSLLSFTVCGVFKEAESRGHRPPIRWFSRSFLTVPYGEGMVITNDMLTIVNASPEQVQKSFKHPAPTPNSSPVQEASPATNSFETQTVLSQEQKQKMILSFVNDSGMNAECSARCLEEHDWNYEKAGLVFLELKKQNKIPPEAFLK